MFDFKSTLNESIYNERFKYFRERTNYRKIICSVLVRRLRRFLNYVGGRCIVGPYTETLFTYLSSL